MSQRLDRLGMSRLIANKSERDPALLEIGRDKDLALVKALLELRKTDPAVWPERFHSKPLGERELFRAGRNFAELEAC